MRLFLLFICVLVIQFGAIQAQSDMAVIDIKASSDVNNWVPEGLNTTLAVTIQNMDSIAIPAGDSVYLSIQTGLYMASAWVTLDNGLDTMQMHTHNFGGDNRLTFTETMDTTAIMAMVTHLNDTNLTNNQYEETFYASTIVNNDWYAGPIEIIEPSNLNFFDVDNGTNVPPPLSEIEVSLINNGTVTYLEGTLIEYEIYVDNDVRQLSGEVTSDVASGETSVRIVSNKAVLPVIPDSVGTYQLCARSLTPNDLTPNNNAACMVFKIIDNFDPEDPNNWPFATEEIEAEQAHMFVSNRNLVVETRNNHTLEIIDLSGKVIHSETISGNSKLALDHLSSGIYFARLLRDNQEPQTMKVLLH